MKLYYFHILYICEGHIVLNTDGTVNMNSGAVKDGRVTLNNDGSIRKNCRALNNGELLIKPTTESTSNIDKKTQSATSQATNSSKKVNEATANEASVKSLIYESTGNANGRQVQVGPRGGHFYVNNNDKKTYVDTSKVREVTNNHHHTSAYTGGYSGNSSPVSTYSSSGSANGRSVYQGSRGGQYYFTASGNKSYF